MYIIMYSPTYLLDIINTNNEKNRSIDLLDDYFNYSKKVNR